MKKKTALLLIVVLLLTITVLPASANTTNVSTEDVVDLPDTDHWSYEPIGNLIAMGVVRGYPSAGGDGTVEILPDQNITRAEFAAMLVQALNLQPDSAKKAPFTDVSGWYKEAVDNLYANDITKGYQDNTFRPDSKIKRAELAAMLVGALHDKGDETSKTFADVPESYWGNKPVLRAAHLGIINGYPGGLFKPEAYATRAEVMAMIYQFMRNDRTQAPSDSTLLDITDTYINRQITALSSRPVDFAPLGAYVTGEKEYMLAPEEEAFKNIADIATISYEKLAPGQVEFKSDRLARVAYSAKLTVTMKIGDTPTPASKNFNDYYLLMKIGDKWLIYSNFDDGLELEFPQSN